MPVTGLAEWLTAQVDADAAGAWAVHDVAKCDAMLYEESMSAYARREPDCDCLYPVRVMRDVAFRRKIIALYDCATAELGRRPVGARQDADDPRVFGWARAAEVAARDLAESYRDCPGYPEAIS